MLMPTCTDTDRDRSIDRVSRSSGLRGMIPLGKRELIV